ncbi:MAG: hemerythrin domain-containing protein [Phycisphaerae bacterium]
MSRPPLAVWLREEHLKVEALADQLRQAAAVVPRVSLQAWINQLGERLAHFRAHMAKHMAMEEEGGYMAEVLERRPSLAKRVTRLQHQHKQVRRLLDDLYRLVGDMTAEDFLLAHDCSHRIDNLLSYIQRHEEAENELVEFVFTDDIGTRD